jgi:hypothetical protein
MLWKAGEATVRQSTRTVLVQEGLICRDLLQKHLQSSQSIGVELFVRERLEHGLGWELWNLSFLVGRVKFEMRPEPHELAISPRNHGRSLCDGLVIRLQGIISPHEEVEDEKSGQHSERFDASFKIAFLDS